MLLEELIVEPVVEPNIPDLYEIIRGHIVEVPPMSFYANEVAGGLNDLFVIYLKTNPLGRSRVEQSFEIPLPEDESRVMRPDLAYFSYDRCPKDRPMLLKGLGLDVIPELVVEVISPNDEAEKVLAKTRDYFRGGVSTVWQIYPQNRVVLVFDSATGARLVLDTEELVHPLLPGFAFKLVDILPPVESEDD